MQFGADCSDLASCNIDTLDDPGLMGDDSFCEVFTDLSNYLLGTGNMDDMDVVMAPATEPSTSKASQILENKTFKRSASTAELEDINKIPPPNPDHNDYISKSKKLRITSSVTSVTSVDSRDRTNLNGRSYSKNEKYIERRRKNNIASRRSRETRKQKFSQMEEQAIELEKSNELLRQKVEELECLTKQMKETLVERLARRK